MAQLSGIDQYGVLKAVPPRVVAVVSLWVVLADGIFWGMAAHAQHIEARICVIEGLALCLALAAAADSFVLRLSLAILSAAIFGAMIFSFCGLIAFAILVAAQVGLMQYCALAVLGPRIQNLKTRLIN